MITAQLYRCRAGAVMTFLPFVNSYSQPQLKQQDMDPAASSLEMTRLTESQTAQPKVFQRKMKSSSFSLLHLASCLLVVSLVVGLSLAGLCLYIFSRSEDSPSDLFNVIVVGGRGEDNSSLLSVELIDLGGCSHDSSSVVVVPSLPEALTDLSVSYLNESLAVEVCGGDGGGHLTCFTLTNSSSLWERSVRSGSPVTAEPLPAASPPAVGHRHGAAILHLSHSWLAVGGRR